MKKILVASSVREIEDMLARDGQDINIISYDIKPCEQSYRFQEYIMGVIVYTEK